MRLVSRRPTITQRINVVFNVFDFILDFARD